MKKKIKSEKLEIKLPERETVFKGQVFSLFFEEAKALLQELQARREFDAQAARFLKSKGLLEEFDAFRKKTE